MMEKIRPFLTLIWNKKRQQEYEIEKLFKDTKNWEDYEENILKDDDLK